MKSLFSMRKAALAAAVTVAFSLTACQAPAGKVASPVVAAAPKPVNAPLTQRELGDGLYEMAAPTATKALFVASAQGFKEVNGGMIYRLDPTTLAIKGETHTDLKNFAMAEDDNGEVIYTTNTLDGGVSKIDAQSGKVLQRIAFKGKDKDGDPVGAREILFHNGLLYVGGVADPGFISVVDAKTMKLKTRINNAGKWVTGLIYSPLTDRVYAANGGGEVLVINPHTNKIEKRLTANDGKAYLFLNLAEDPATGRLFVTDDSKAKATLVFDERSGRVIKRIEGDALGIKFNVKRNEIYISQRESKKVLQLDGTTYAVKNSWSFATHPNSLLVSADGETLYVTLKQDFNKDNSTKGPDSVARIALK
ncbi:YncE family protein [Pantoea sp.]|uniref:YncE family protein n=1 Tax=Pantoea sp. TaxID=69393 RepID=UPI00289A1D72|nr:YncE family protein [Pantoea sp.]